MRDESDTDKEGSYSKLRFADHNLRNDGPYLSSGDQQPSKHTMRTPVLGVFVQERYSGHHLRHSRSLCRVI